VPAEIQIEEDERDVRRSPSNARPSSGFEASIKSERFVITRRTSRNADRIQRISLDRQGSPWVWLVTLSGHDGMRGAPRSRGRLRKD